MNIIYLFFQFDAMMYTCEIGIWVKCAVHLEHYEMEDIWSPEFFKLFWEMVGSTFQKIDLLNCNVTIIYFYAVFLKDHFVFL